MTDATRARNTNHIEGRQKRHLMAAGETVYAGTLVESVDGYLQPGGDDSGAIFQGVALETVDNSGGSDGAKDCLVQKYGTWHFGSASRIDQTGLGGVVYLSDDQNVAHSDDVSNDIACGRIEQVEDDGSVWIAIDHYTKEGETGWTEEPTTTEAA